MIQKTTIIPSFILGTAGHIDHGKSRLVQQLTGTDPDRLAEEKRRGITIELGFAALQLPGGGLCGVVDVPGHERFVRHMVEGATGVDIALLVVAADDGVMVQTREHLSILELLGVRGLVVALNKIDLVEPDMVDLAALDVAELLQETTFAGAQIVPVSATTGAGLPNLLAAIEDAATHITRPTRGDCARLPIDRVFSTRGAGTVVTGTLWDGSIRVGDSLELIAAESVHSRISSGSSSTTSSKQVRVRDLQVHGTASPEARRGQRVALNLGGISRSQVKRGQMLCTPKSLVPCSHFYAYLQYTGMPQHPTPLKDRTQVLLHHGTREVTARVKLLAQVGEAATPIAPGDGGFVQLRADCALPLRCGDRFIIRNLSPAFTIGGGVVLLTCGRGRTKLSSEWFELLQLLQEKDNCETASKTAILHYVALQNAPQSCQQVAGTLGISKTVVARTLNQSDLARLKVAGETLYLGAAALVDVQTRSEEAVLAYHKQNPQSRGISMGALYKLVFPQADAPQTLAWNDACFEAVLQQQVQAGTLNFDAGKVSHPQDRSKVQDMHKQLAEQLVLHISQQGLSVESVSELATSLQRPRDVVAQVLGQMTADGRLIRLAGDYHFAPQHVAAAQQTLVDELKSRKDSGISAAEARDLWCISRKYAIWLLEYFDTQGITRRDGNTRYLK